MAQTSPEANRELRTLLWAQLAGELDPAQGSKLETLLVGDPAALSEYVAYTRMLIDMRSLEAPESFDNQPFDNSPLGKPPVATAPGGGILGFLGVVWGAVQSSPRLVVLTLGSALTAYFVVVLALIPLARSLQRAADPLQERSASPGAEQARTTDIGSLVSGGQARWTQKPSAPGAAGMRVGDRYELASGLASIVLARGTRVAVEGPATWRFVSEQQLQLDSGRIVAQVPPAAIGFTVVTPEATIVDLGTEFGVEVDKNGATDLHVYRGQVELRHSQTKGVAAADTASSTRVAAGESRHIDGSGNVSIVHAAGAASQLRRILTSDQQGGGSLDLVDLLAGGDGNGQRRNVSIDPRDGRCGDLELVIQMNGDGTYHATPHHAVMDGCFIPSGSNADRLGWASLRLSCDPRGQLLSLLGRAADRLARLSATPWSDRLRGGRTCFPLPESQ